MAVPTVIKREPKKSTVCRVCLNLDIDEIGKGLSLFEKQNDTLISEKIKYIANIEVNESDGLPDRICSNCLLSLEIACNFKTKCEQSDIILRAEQQRVEVVQVPFGEVSVKHEVSDDCEYFDENEQTEPFLQPSEDKPNIGNPQTSTLKGKGIDLKLKCNDCSGVFPTKCKLRVHWKKEHLPALLVCPICKKTCKTFKAFNTHTKKKYKRCMNAEKVRIEGEGKFRVYHCKECDYNTNQMEYLIKHLVVHTGERPYKCDLCDKTFTQLGSLNTHKEDAHMDIVTGGTCHQCGKHFKGKKRLQRHIKSHLDTKVQCEVCSKYLKSKESLKQHMVRHTGVKSFTCDICAKTFYTIADLYNHKSTIHVKKVYTCQICGYKTFNCTLMTKHRRKHVTHNVACSVCGMFFDTTEQVEIHKKIHLERHECCMYCDKKFHTRKGLGSHVRSVHKMYAVNGGKRSIDKKTNDPVKPDVKVEHDNQKPEVQ